MSPTISYYDHNGNHIDTHYFTHGFFHDEDHAYHTAEEYWPDNAVEARVESLDFTFEVYHTPVLY